MGMTMTQKILAAHAGLDKVRTGQLVEADLDLVLGNDITAPVAIRNSRRWGPIRFTINQRLPLCWITLLPTRISRLPSNAGL